MLQARHEVQSYIRKAMHLQPRIDADKKSSLNNLIAASGTLFSWLQWCSFLKIWSQVLSFGKFRSWHLSYFYHESIIIWVLRILLLQIQFYWYFSADDLKLIFESEGKGQQPLAHQLKSISEYKKFSFIYHRARIKQSDYIWIFLRIKHRFAWMEHMCRRRKKYSKGIIYIYLDIVLSFMNEINNFCAGCIKDPKQTGAYTLGFLISSST